MKMGKEHTVIKVGEGTEKGREKVWSKELGCHTAIQFQMKTFPDVRVNVVYTMLVAIGLFLIAAQLLPLSSFDAKLLGCATEMAAKQDTLQPLLSQALLHEKINTTSIDVRHGEVRVFKPHGLATHLYIEMSAYRGGPRAFSIVGLTSKPVETHHRPPYACEWVSRSTGQVIKGRPHKVLPDWDYGKLYTVVVITCNFVEDVGVDGDGGELILYASYGDHYRQPERIVALTESKGEYNASIFDPQNFPYDYVYCGSSVYGDISPQRMREWMAYHAKFLGDRSHFFLHDAGGFHEDVRKVLEPWIQQGRVTLQNIRQQEIYDGYYHNQFLIVNDCLFRSRFMANWTFFFDIDEYMYVEPTTTLAEVLNENPNITQITIEQVPMAKDMCVADNSTQGEHQSRWGFEKLVYRKVLKRGIRYDRKYVVQARHAEAAGIHMSMNMRKGQNLYPKGDRIRYYHYHGTINKRDEVCNIFVDSGNKTAVQRHEKHYHRLEETMAKLGKEVKLFELNTVGPQPVIV
ncbi:hypothetical protein M758_1G316700 [Ceratodon purpureus]|nr:hypothetical protein M758_1G316700 [Ceratodon purpureus]